MPQSGSVTNNPQASQIRISAEDDASLQGVGDRIASAGAITVKPLSPIGRSIGQLINPLAPTEPQPDTRWLSRTPWNAAAEKARGSVVPIEERHEPSFGLSFAGL